MCNKSSETTPVVVHDLFLGLVEKQDLTNATLSTKIVYGLFLVEGMLMVVGNCLLIAVIVAYRPLRRKEMYIVAGLAMGDLLYGAGFFFSGIRRLTLALGGRHLWMVSPWSCMTAIQTPFFIAGSQAAAFMLVILSVDRLLAVHWFALYTNFTTSYAKNVLFAVFLYSFLTIPLSALLSAFGTDSNAKVAAICISTQVGPHWFASYQPTIQLACGVLSVVIYVLTWRCYQHHIKQMCQLQQVHCRQQQRQRRLTRTVGITVLFTFFCYVLPHSTILFFNAFQASKNLASVISPYGWVVSNVNSIVNIFIIGMRNQDVKLVLWSWMKCTKPQFAGGHTVSVSVSPRVRTACSNLRCPSRPRSQLYRYYVKKALYKSSSREEVEFLSEKPAMCFNSN